MSKKAALVFNWMLTFLVIAILTFSLLKFSTKYSKFSVIGKKQLDLFTTYQKAESALFFIDQSAKYALQQSVYDLSRNGGTFPAQNTKGCDNFYGYSVWYSLEKGQNNEYLMKSCFGVERVNESLIGIFNMSLNKYLDKYPSNIHSNYSYQVKEGIEITAKASKPINFDIMKE